MEEYFQAINEQIDNKDASSFDESFYDKLKQNLVVFENQDGRLRDDIGWGTLSKLFQSDLFAKNKRSDFLLELLSSEYLFFNIDEGETNSSVKRSFSVLALADLIYGDLDFGNTFDHSMLSEVSANLRNYLKREKDYRGFVEGLGWVHAIAHTGDAMSAVALHPQTSDADVEANLKSVLGHIKFREFDVFKWEEHFRLGRSIGRMINRLGVDQFLKVFSEEIPESYMYEQPYAQNMLNTMRCAYLEVHWRQPENFGQQEKLKSVLQG